jgi:hypothetical protein
VKPDGEIYRRASGFQDHHDRLDRGHQGRPPCPAPPTCSISR